MLILQKRYERQDAQRNPRVLYVFGDNVKRVGMGGQAFVMRGEPNAVGVATKYAPSTNPMDYFGEDAIQIEVQKRIIDEDMKPLFKRISEGGVVVWPMDGIGTGLSKLPELAPTTMAYIDAKLSALFAISELFSQNRLNAAKKIANEHV